MIFVLRNSRSAQAQMSARSRADDDSDQLICERVSLTAPDNLSGEFTRVPDAVLLRVNHTWSS